MPDVFIYLFPKFSQKVAIGGKTSWWDLPLSAMPHISELNSFPE